jgi:hypothetical protein
MPLLQWLADQHYRKLHDALTTATPPSPSVAVGPVVAAGVGAEGGGDAGAASRFVASALVREWSTLSLPALAALVRVLAIECASFLPTQPVPPSLSLSRLCVCVCVPTAGVEGTHTRLSRYALAAALQGRGGCAQDCGGDAAPHPH